MIKDHDRSDWFGASDVDKIVAKNRNTKSWQEWWLQKMGIARSHYESKAMNAGTNKEHMILEYICAEMETDRQILIPELRLRVNLDGNIGNEIIECKTHGADKPFKMPQKYIQQVRVQMYAFKTNRARIAVYALTEADMHNYFLPIDPARLTMYPVEQDMKWIEGVFLPNLRELCAALNEGRMPV